jgi:hypothetical protein
MVLSGHGQYCPAEKRIVAQASQQKLKRMSPGALSDVLFYVVGPADEQGIVTVAGYLVYRIAANLARVEVVQNFQFLV